MHHLASRTVVRSLQGRVLKGPEPTPSLRIMQTYCNRSHLSEAIQNMIEVQQQNRHQQELLHQQQTQKQADLHHEQHPLREQHQQQDRPQAQHFIYHASSPRPPRVPFQNPPLPERHISTTTEPRRSSRFTTRHSTDTTHAGRHPLIEFQASQVPTQHSHRSTNLTAQFNNAQHEKQVRLQPRPLPVGWSQPVGVFEYRHRTEPALLLSALRSHILSRGPAAVILPWTSLQDVTDVLLLLSDDIKFAVPGHSMVVTPLVYSEQQHTYPSHQQRHQQRGCSPERIREAVTDDAIFHTAVSFQEAEEFVLVISTCVTEKLEAAALTLPSVPLLDAQNISSYDLSRYSPSTAQMSACNIPLTQLGSFESLLQDGRAAAIDRLLDGVVCKGESTLELQCRYDTRSIREAFQVLADTGALLRNTRGSGTLAEEKHSHDTEPALHDTWSHAQQPPESVDDLCSTSNNKHEMSAYHPRLADIAELLSCSPGSGACMQAYTQHGNLVLQPEVLLRRCSDGRRRGALFFSVHILRSVSPQLQCC